MDYSGTKDNFVGNTDTFSKEMPVRGRKKKKASPHIESIDNSDSMISADDPNFNQLLPAVKVKKPRKKKRSPSSNSARGGGGSIGHFNHSTSRMSTSGLKDPKLRDTLDQNLHFVPTSVKVPVKQTAFYDDKH